MDSGMTGGGKKKKGILEKEKKKPPEMLEMVSESCSRPLVSVYPNLELTTFE
jgi:hypothetical protein